MARRSPSKKSAAPAPVSQIKHGNDKRANNPTAEYQTNLTPQAAEVKTLRIPRNPDLDPQLVWRGKDLIDADALLEVAAPAIYIQEKIQPKFLIEDLRRHSRKIAPADNTPDLFADFNGIPQDTDRTDFYAHSQNWTNRMILGDSLQVMASLIEKESLRGKVQCVYIDPPYGIRFNSNFQWCTTTANTKDGRDFTREPEMVKAYRDTWRDGIHSYLSYLRDRIAVARELLTDSGSIFIQIGDENVHRVRSLLDEVFGPDNFVAIITYVSTSGLGAKTLVTATNYIVWFAKNKETLKYRQIFLTKEFGGAGASAYKKFELENGERTSISDFEKNRKEKFDYTTHCEKEKLGRVYCLDNVKAAGAKGDGKTVFCFRGKKHTPGDGVFKTNLVGMERLAKANRLDVSDKGRLGYIRYFDDFSAFPLNNVWTDTSSSFMDKIYVVQSTPLIVQRCLLMTTDPGDLVLDPTCGSGTTAYVAEQWGRRWITIDTSRVALALARARLMGARFPYYLLKDSKDGRDLAHNKFGPEGIPSDTPHDDVRQGFVYNRLLHIKLGNIANDANIDEIWAQHQPAMEKLQKRLNAALGEKREEWEIPLTCPDSWPAPAKKIHTEWARERRNRQAEIDESIARASDFEDLLDRPYEDKKRVRVAGPFTVETVAPHTILTATEDGFKLPTSLNESGERHDFATMILRELRAAGVQYTHRKDRTEFSSVEPFPMGNCIAAEARRKEGSKEIRSAIFIGPEFGTVMRADLVNAAKEAAELGFDELISCAFNYGPHAGSLDKLGKIPVIKARMNAELHMAENLKSTGKGNLFVVFGEPDIEILHENDNKIRVRIRGVDVYKPQSGQVESSEPDDIACWFIDTDYNSESFFVRHVYFLGQNSPYKNLKKSLQADIDEAAWKTLHSNTSRPFDIPPGRQIAVKVINYLGDEVMKVINLR